jgi:hypothetical protein
MCVRVCYLSMTCSSGEAAVMVTSLHPLAWTECSLTLCIYFWSKVVLHCRQQTRLHADVDGKCPLHSHIEHDELQQAACLCISTNMFHHINCSISQACTFIYLHARAHACGSRVTASALAYTCAGMQILTNTYGYCWIWLRMPTCHRHIHIQVSNIKCAIRIHVASMHIQYHAEYTAAS